MRSATAPSRLAAVGTTSAGPPRPQNMKSPWQAPAGDPLGHFSASGRRTGPLALLPKTTLIGTKIGHHNALVTMGRLRAASLGDCRGAGANVGNPLGHAFWLFGQSLVCARPNETVC
jgi:hypothetical protein